jgi:SAM-dependent methyltransferase
VSFRNVYEDAARADAYARLEFPGTYYLAFRDLPAILREHATGGRALDFGCGAGRSTRFLKGLGFEVTGVDVSGAMVRHARQRDARGDYRVVAPADLSVLEEARFDVVLSAFTFDNIPTPAEKGAHLRALARRLAPSGRMVNLVSRPEIYRHEWASFSTRDFPENLAARSGDVVRIVMTDVVDRRPVEDVLFDEASYLSVYRGVGLERVAAYAPLGREDEPFVWVNETRVAPWRIDVLARAGQPGNEAEGRS